MTLSDRAPMQARVGFAAGLALALAADAALAQGWNTNAREIAIGGIGATESLATKMMDEDVRDRAVPIPLGVVQILGNVSVFDPSSDEFNPFRIVEYLASPLHYVRGRNDPRPVDDLVADVINARVSRDLNEYAGVAPAEDEALAGEGLVNPGWGATLRFGHTPGGSYQGVFIGAGPYLATRTATSVDPQLREILSNTGDPIYFPRETFLVSHSTTFQAAASITVGYRVKIGAGGSRAATRDGLYLGANYRYLWGFWYSDLPESDGLRVRLDTNSSGLLTIPLCALPPPIGTTPPCVPLSATYNNSTRGRGRAVDLGVGAISGPWEVGFGITGIGNRIDWEEVEQTTYTHLNLFLGGDLAESPTDDIGTVRVELPVDYRGNVSYRAAEWGVFGEWAHGFGGQSLRAGGERVFGPTAVRAGLFRVREQWHPSVGAGVEMAPRVWFDVALFASSANLRRERDLAVALSIRVAGDR